MKYITIALAKGRLAKQTLALLEQTGITCEEMKDKDTRKLIFINEELKLKFFLSKTSDVPTYVEYGAADLGVVGSDTIMEEGRKVLEVLDLGLGKCNMCVAGPASAKELLHNNQVIRVASKYPAIVGLSEVIVDIVETGSTLKANGLEVLETICPLSARVIVNEASMKLQRERITKLIKDLKQALE